MAGENEDEEFIVERVPNDEPGAITPQDGVDELKAKLAQTRADLSAERSARTEAEGREAVAVRDKIASDLTTVTSAIETVKSNQNIFQAELASAMEATDYVAAANIQVKIANAAAHLAQLEAGKTRLEAMAKAPRAPADPVERIAANLTPRSAAWLRAHPEYAEGAKNSRMIGAHHLALGNGLKPDTDEYFAEVERVLGISDSGLPEGRQQPRREAPAAALAADDPTSDAAKATGGRSASPPAAPVRDGGGGASGVRKTVVRLTAEEREMAEMSGISEVDYAKNKMQLQKEGKLN